MVLYTLHLQLHFLYGEARVDKQHGVLALVGLRTGEERCEGALHAAYHGHTAFGFDINIDEGLDETRGLTLQLGIALNVGILRGDALLQCLYLGIYTHLGGRQSWYAHFHFYIFYAAGLLGFGSYLFHFADGCLGKILYAKFIDQLVNNFFFNRSWFHSYDIDGTKVQKIMVRAKLFCRLFCCITDFS